MKQIPFPARRERLALLAILLAAFALRLIQLDHVPPGLRYDELLSHVMAGRVMAGERPIYFVESWGREPLYFYVQALGLTLLGESDWVLRLPSVFLGLLEVTGVWLVGRRLFGKGVGLVAAALVAVSFWAIFYSRIGSRVGATAAFITFFVYFLWRAVEPPAGRAPQHRATLFTVAAALTLGALSYVYVAGRVGFALVGLFALYLAIFHRRQFRQVWRRLLVIGVGGAAVAGPLFLYLSQNPGAEQRLDLLNAPMNALKAGDPGPILELATRALGMYVYEGERNWLYNVFGRPIFRPVTAAFFLLGGGNSLRHGRRAGHALILIWLLVGTAPAMLAPPAASLTHTVAARPAAMLLLALGANAVARWLGRRRAWVQPALAIAVVALYGVSSSLAYFGTWSQADEVHELYQAGIKRVADEYQSGPSSEPVAVGAPYVNYWHPWNAVAFELAVRQPAPPVRWFNPAGAWVWPGGSNPQPTTYYFPAAPLAPQSYHPLIHDAFLAMAEPLPAPGHFEAFHLPDPAALEDALRELAPDRHVTWPPDLAHLPAPALPLVFDDRLALLSVGLPQETTSPGRQVPFYTIWEVRRSDPAPVVAFAHLTSDGVDIWGQQDWLDVRMKGLQEGDRFIQTHTLPVNAETPAGSYAVQIGLYHPGTLGRLPIAARDASADRVFVGEIEVAPDQ
jgi:4-amino-4-deoxy-L-arabinose transferase-like glycosyltransferase